MKVFALVRDVEQVFLESKTDQVQFCESLGDLQKKIDTAKGKVQFILSGDLVFYLDEFKEFICDNTNTTFLFYSEEEDCLDLIPRKHLKTRNFVEEFINAEELVDFMNDKIYIKVRKENPWYKGELRLSRK